MSSRPSPGSRSSARTTQIRDDARRSPIGLVGAEAVLRLFPEQERNDRVFTAITRFLDLLDEADRRPLAPISIRSGFRSS